MIIIKHRINTIDELIQTPRDLGVEIDIRSDINSLYLHHDPFSYGEAFSEWLMHYNHRFLILNVKEEGLEDLILEQLNSRGIKDFFFLDQSFPFLFKTFLKCNKQMAIRLSEFESIETVKSFAGKAKWVWLDFFTKLAISGEEARLMQQELNYRICLVSPELHGYDHNEVLKFKEDLAEREIFGDAVCTKHPYLWL